LASVPSQAYPTLPYPTLLYPTLLYHFLPYPTVPYLTPLYPTVLTLPSLPFPARLPFSTSPYPTYSTYPILLPYSTPPSVIKPSTPKGEPNLGVADHRRRGKLPRKTGAVSDSHTDFCVTGTQATIPLHHIETLRTYPALFVTYGFVT